MYGELTDLVSRRRLHFLGPFSRSRNIRFPKFRWNRFRFWFQIIFAQEMIVGRVVTVMVPNLPTYDKVPHGYESETDHNPSTKEHECEN